MSDKLQSTFHTVVHDDVEQVNQCIREHLRSDIALVGDIGQYIIQSGGKRLRPLLVLLAARACSYQGTHHILLATIIEFLHTATLLHDDVVDQSDLRRGRRTANAVWNNAASVLVGDCLYSRAFQMMISLDNMQLLNVLANATNTIAEGEVMQLMHIQDVDISEARYMEIIHCKTAMLFQASSHTAAILAGDDHTVAQALADYGHYVGMAFQLMDDLLDYAGDSHTMGKHCGDDLLEGKPTLPLIFTLMHGTAEQQALIRQGIKPGGCQQMEPIIQAVRSCGALDYTAEQANVFANQAVACLSVLPNNRYREALAELARFAAVRNH